MDAAVPDRRARKGRGAATNASGRFEAETRHVCDDGWGVDPETESAPVRTTVTVERAKSAITYNTSPDLPFDRTVNPYRGCEHGCVYCYARPSHAYMGLSPGLDFETRLFAKDDLAEALARDLRKPGYAPAPIMLGANTDCYQPIERGRGVTRRVLEVLDEADHPVLIVTKSAGVLRDLDLLARMAARRLVSVGVSITTLDGALARALEPRASSPSRRLAAVAALAEAGVPVTAMASPMIPCLNDHELEAILDAAVAAGATQASMTLLRLPLELKDLFAEWLDVHAPLKKDRVLSHVRAMRGGRLYDPDFATRMRGSGVYADLLAKRFRLACDRLGLRRREPGEYPLDASAFKRPERAGDQLSLL
jgi:DNA repair photolyase